MPRRRHIAAGGRAEDREYPGGEKRDSGAGVGPAVDKGPHVGGGAAGSGIGVTKRKEARRNEPSCLQFFPAYLLNYTPMSVTVSPVSLSVITSPDAATRNRSIPEPPVTE